MITPRPFVPAVSDAETRLLWEHRTGMESFLREMRSRGAWQIESIKAVRELAGVSLGEAKKVVHFSQTWADTRKASEALHEVCYEALDELQRESDAVHSQRLAS